MPKLNVTPASKLVILKSGLSIDNVIIYSKVLPGAIPNPPSIIEDMQNTVIKDNVWHHGVTKEFLVDKGGNERCVIKDNLGQVRIDGDHLG